MNKTWPSSLKFWKRSGPEKLEFYEFQVKLVEADEKMTSLSRELESVKSELKTNSEKMNFDQKKFGTVNETLKEQLDQATEKIEQVFKFFISSLHWIISLLFFSFLYSGVYYVLFKLSASEVIGSQKSSNGERK